MAAGAASKKGVIGYVVPFGTPEVVRHINAFTLGAQATHPGAKVKIVWTNAWYSPPKETAAAQNLAAAGVDVLGQNVDSPATGVYAEKHGIPWVGYDSNAQSSAPKQWLTAAVYNWGPYYLRRVKAAMNGTWKPGFYYGSIKDGFTNLAPFGPKVSAETRAKIAAKQKAIVSGKFSVFQGPLYDQKGKLMVPAGKRSRSARPVHDAVARQGRDREHLQGHASASPVGEPAPASAVTREAPVQPAPLRLPPCAWSGSRSASPAWSRTRSVELRGRGRARCTRCSARTAPARRRSRTSSPASTGRTRADRGLRRAGALPLAARRARRRDLHGAPAFPPGRAVYRGRERRARRPPWRGPPRSSSTRRRSSGGRRAERALRPRRRSPGAGSGSSRSASSSASRS